MSKSPFTDNSAERKKFPVYSGVIKYFPLAIAKVSRLSLDGNEKHNKGEALHWSRDKSADHEDALMRHIMDGDWTEVAWRALAILQIECEKE